jgi:hypothetical protein
VVVAPMSRLAWAAVSLGATGFLAALALTGGRDDGIEPFKPKGLMTLATEEVREVDVTGARGHFHFERTPSGWRATEGEPGAGFEIRVESALKLLHNSGPDRVMNQAELTGVDPEQFGLATPRLRLLVSGRDGSVFAISFGITNPMGLSHYARLDGSREIALLPAFLAEEWERTGATP